MNLSLIKKTIMQVAEAITAALDIETEIVDDKLEIIGGTGRYRSKIGTYEEDGDLKSNLLYSELLRSGKPYICTDTQSDKKYHAVEGELAEIACPIISESKVYGLIGLVAFSEEQRRKIMDKTPTLLAFLERMSELIASKLLLTANMDKLKVKLDSILNDFGKRTVFDDIIGVSQALEIVKQRGMQVATSDSTVLIRGESGTGKELFARAIHFSGNRRDEPFVSVNCGAIPEMLLESELFGYEKGAFTGADKTGKSGKFELANRGTILLDEVGDMPLHLQVKLLSAIQSRRIDKVGGCVPIDVDVRIIAATNKNLEEMIATKQFREDLYFRLNVIPLDIPPLRERREDIIVLLNYSLEKFNSLLGKSIIGFTQEVKSFLCDYQWPGNVRELENVVEYSVNMNSGELISFSDLPDRIKNENTNFKNTEGRNLQSLTEQFEKNVILSYMEKMGNSLEVKRKIAQLLEISESTLYRRLR